MPKKIIALLLCLCLLPLFALAEAPQESVVINLALEPDAAWQFQEGADILEICFPPVRGADACILRYQDRVMLVDAGTPGQHERVAAALEYLGITHIDTGFNTHPHDDHIGGFDVLYEAASMGELIITFPEDFNNNIIRTMRAMKEQGVPVRHAADGDLLPFGDVRLEVIQRDIYWFPDNDCSAMIRVDYGERSMLLTADIGTDAQNNYLKTAPEKLDVDVFKYPHHGVGAAGWNFLKHMDAEFAVITNNRHSTQETLKDCARRGIATLNTSDGMVRLRTDGVIWVVDQIELDVE